MENFPAVLSSMDPRSEILTRMVLNRSKVSYMIRYGLYPHMHNNIVRRIKEGGRMGGGYFTLGTDSSTIKHIGIQKHVDLVIRYWNEITNQVEAAFFDLHVVGHEPAILQVNNILKSFSESNIPVL